MWDIILNIKENKKVLENSMHMDTTTLHLIKKTDWLDIQEQT